MISTTEPIPSPPTTTSPPPPAANHQSLLSFISSPFFRDFYIITYLYDKIHQDEIIPHLLDKFATYSHAHFQELLPFVIFLCDRFKNERIKKWLCQRVTSADDIRPYLIIRWGFLSTESESSAFNETFINLLDSYAINRTPPPSPSLSLPSTDTLSKQQLTLMIQKKIERSNYIPIVLEFYQKLMKICVKLKGVEEKERNGRLRGLLEGYWKGLQGKLEGNCGSMGRVKGFGFPVEEGGSWVVRVDYEECVCFSTRERVPYKIVFETVELGELEEDERKEKEKEKQQQKEGKGEQTGKTPQPQKQKPQSGSTSDIESSTSQQSPHDDLLDLITAQRQVAIQMKNYLQQKKKSQKQKPSSPSPSSNPLNQTSMLALHTSSQSSFLQTQRLKSLSPFSHLPSLSIRSYIIKSGDDLRQQAFTLQLLKILNSIFLQSNLKLSLRTYSIIITSPTSGFIQYIPDTITLSTLKKSSPHSTLPSIFLSIFKQKQETAVINFVTSLASYSLVQYLFLIKDRHNGNILLDSEGHLIHIDFGFLLGSSPGGMGFETPPFKLPMEYVEIIGGTESELWKYFKELLFLGFVYVRRYVGEIVKFVRVVRESVGLMRCFEGYREAEMERRFMVGCTDKEVRRRVEKLVGEAMGSRMTAMYDQFQWKTNGIWY